MPAVSFIIPMYNCAETLERTVSSVLRQSLSDIQIILANDGSTDGTREIAEKLEASDGRVELLSRPENKGVSYTRNEALKLASGKYIRFVDADDTIPKRSTEKMVEAAERDGSELVIGIMRKKSSLGSYNFADTEELAGKKVISPDDPALVNSFSLCNKLLRRDIIEKYNIRFGPYRHAEDGLFLFEYMSHISRISGCDIPVYTYYSPEFFETASSTSDLDIGQLRDAIEVGEKIRDAASCRGEEFVRAIDRRMAEKTLLNEYYRKIWRFDAETEHLLIDALNRYRSRLGQAAWKNIATTHRDLDLYDRIPTTDDIAKSPLLTLAISGTVQKDSLPAMLESLYYQKLPSFAVVIHESLKDSVPPYYAGKKNLSFSDSSDMFNDAVSERKSRFFLFADRAVMFTSDSLLKSILLLMKKNVDFIGGNLAYAEGGALCFPPEYQYAYASYACGESDVMTPNDMLDPYLSNKVISRASIARERFAFTGKSNEDIKRIYSVFRHGKYRSIKYLLPSGDTRISDMPLIPESTYKRFALLSLTYKDEPRLTSEIKPLYDARRKNNGLKKTVLFVPAEEELGPEAKALYDALTCRKEIVSVSEMNDISERMLLYSGYQCVVFESFDFRLRRNNVAPGQTIIPLAGEICTGDRAVEEAVQFITYIMKDSRLGLLEERKVLKDWLDGASEEEEDQDGLFLRLCDKYSSEFPVDEKRVLFISDMRSEMGENYQALANALPRDMDIRTFFKPDKSTGYTQKDLDTLANLMCTSKCIILEDYFRFTSGYTVRGGQQLCQLWHACGAFKKFAASRAISGEALNLHKGYSKYTRVTVSSDAIRQNYAEAFGIDIDRVQACGVPRTDLFFRQDVISEKQKKIHELFPVMNGKKVILFAPTYRGESLDSASYDFDMLDPEKLYEKLHDEYVFVFKWHPAAYANLNKRGTDVYHMSEHPDFFLDLSGYRDINELLLVTDVLVTDYSSIIFDYIFMDKPVVFYTYDLDSYSKGGRDWYYDFSEYTYGPVAEDMDSLIDAIKSGELCEEKRDAFREKFMSACDGHSAEKTAAYFIR